jgi:hypothetical protein
MQYPKQSVGSCIQQTNYKSPYKVVTITGALRDGAVCNASAVAESTPNP